jgi:hypothetical protein
MPAWPILLYSSQAQPWSTNTKSTTFPMSFWSLDPTGGHPPDSHRLAQQGILASATFGSTSPEPPLPPPCHLGEVVHSLLLGPQLSPCHSPAVPVCAPLSSAHVQTNCAAKAVWWSCKGCGWSSKGCDGGVASRSLRVLPVKSMGATIGQCCCCK